MVDVNKTIDLLFEPEKWTLERFSVALEDMQEDFYQNLIKLDYPEDRTKDQWMDLFLRWAEWKTDMHERYWGPEFKP